VWCACSAPTRPLVCYVTGGERAFHFPFSSAIAAAIRRLLSFTSLNKRRETSSRIASSRFRVDAPLLYSRLFSIPCDNRDTAKTNVVKAKPPMITLPRTLALFIKCWWSRTRLSMDLLQKDMGCSLCWIDFFRPVSVRRSAVGGRRCSCVSSLLWLVVVAGWYE